jgi:hypothetical protein
VLRAVNCQIQIQFDAEEEQLLTLRQDFCLPASAVDLTVISQRHVVSGRLAAPDLQLWNPLFGHKVLQEGEKANQDNEIKATSAVQRGISIYKSVNAGAS